MKSYLLDDYGSEKMFRIKGESEIDCRLKALKLLMELDDSFWTDVIIRNGDFSLIDLENIKEYE